MKLRYLLSFAALLATVPAVAGAEDISNFNVTLTSGNTNTQLGRLSRNGVQQTWLGGETYPGTINPTTTYNYLTETFTASNFIGAPYVEISVFDINDVNAIFVSAYAGSYNASSPATNWLGDEGGSGNFFGTTDARYFDIVLPPGQALILVLNTTAAAGLGNDPQNIDVSAYADTNYDDPPPVTTTVTPEPSTFITLGTGLVGIAGAVRRKMKK